MDIYIKEKGDAVKEKIVAVKSHAALVKKAKCDGPPLPLMDKAQNGATNIYFFAFFLSGLAGGSIAPPPC